jgi:hypothetical protein
LRATQIIIAQVMLIARYLLVLLFALTLQEAFGQSHCNVRVDTEKILSGANLDDFMSLVKTEQFEIFRDNKDIPVFINEQLKCLTTDNFSLANPGEDFDCCCTTSKALPQRQLILLAKSKREFVLVYKKGLGKVTSTYITIFKRKTDGNIDVWTGYGNSKINSVADIITHVEEQKIKKFMLLKYSVDF